MVQLVEAYPKHALNPSRQGPRPRPRPRKPKPKLQAGQTKTGKRSDGLPILSPTSQYRRPCPARGCEGHPCPPVPSNPRNPKRQSKREGGGRHRRSQPPPAQASRLHTHPPPSSSSTPVPGLAPLAHLAWQSLCGCWSLVCQSVSQPTSPLEATGDCCNCAALARFSFPAFL